MTFHPVIQFPEPPKVLDFTSEGQGNSEGALYSIGRYDENRPGLYTQNLFTGSGRHHHVGIDLGAPASTPVYAYDAGVIVNFGDNTAAGDYGPTLITEHLFEGRPLYVLWGHLSRKSLEGKSIGQKFQAGEVIAWLGDESENGGWFPHLHLQLSWEKPTKPDMPGVVTKEEIEDALRKYPDPRLILGPLY